MSDEKSVENTQSANVPKGEEAVQETAKVDSQPAEQPAESSVEDSTITEDAEKIADAIKATPQEKETPKQDDTEEVPFNEHPRWKEVTSKLGDETKRADDNQQAAQYWQAFNQYAAANPEAAIDFLSDLEDRGMIQKGTVEKAKQEISPTQNQEGTDAPSQTDEQVPDVASAVKQVLQQDPTYQGMDKQRVDKENETEQVLQTLEKNHPDITEAAASDPSVRKQIFMEAQRAARQGKPVDEAFEDAYKWVMKRDDVIAEARETGEVEGLVSGIQQGVATGTSDTGTIRAKSSVKLTAQQKEFAKASDMTEEEYARYLDDPEGAMSEDLKQTN